jgi:hypothetical protein
MEAGFDRPSNLSKGLDTVNPPSLTRFEQEADTAV